jgi:hypothetical protein
MNQKSDDTFNTPILFITFNRPNHTRRVFDEIKKQRPKYFFVFQDGVREGNEADVVKCAAVRSIFDESMDWDCELHTCYSDKNLGCGKGPVTGTTWFFDHVEQGIIIEDDAVPAPDFFKYAEDLLSLYKENQQIKAIGSMNIDGKKQGDSSYYFSMMNRNLCAWATWKRAWSDFDYCMDKISVSQLKSAMMKYNTTKKEINYWCDRLDEIHRNRLNESSWDMQFLMSIWLCHGIGICPNMNLSTNIGFDSEGTHTQDNKNAAANLNTGCILPLKHPTNIRILRNADLNYHKKYFQPNEYGWQGIKRMPYRFNKKLKKLFGHEGSWIKK